jgi:hypothetical protein
MVPGTEEVLYQHPTGAPIVLTDWSADGRYLCFWINDAMFVLPLTGERKLVALNQDEFFGRGGRLSPDSKAARVQLQLEAGAALPGVRAAIRSVHQFTGNRGGPAQKVSADDGNGMGVSWRRDGKELFYLTQGPAPSVVMAVDVSGSSPFTASAPRPLFTLPHPVPNPAQLSQISSANGDRFVFAVNLPQRQAALRQAETAKRRQPQGQRSGVTSPPQYTRPTLRSQPKDRRRHKQTSTGSIGPDSPSP